MDEKVLERVADLLEDYTGLRSPPANRTHLRRALERQARSGGLKPEELLRRIGKDAAERQKLVNAVMIGETYFFREVAQFRLLRSELVPAMLRHRHRLACWSVSCSTGEEAISLAALLDDVRRQVPGLEYQVHATDINTESLERLRAGVYPRSSLRKDGAEYHHLLLERHLSAAEERTVTISETLIRRITSRHLNFFRDDLGVIPEELDFIFFRNTLLYATAEKRREIIARITTRLKPGGYLFLATSELPFVVHPELVLRDFGGVYALQRFSPGESERPATRDAKGARGTRGASKRETAPAIRSGGPRKITSHEVLECLNRQGPEMAENAPGEPEATTVVARLVAECYGAINADQLDRAATVADELCAAAEETALAFFCAGWVHYVAGNRTEAVHAFDRALSLEESFWPARFYRASLNAGTLDTVGVRRAARREFERCITAIEEHESSGLSDRYAYLLEGFSPAYFHRMCSRWITKTTDKEST